MKQDDDTDQVIGDGHSEGESEDTKESTVEADIKEDEFHHQQKVLLLGQVLWEKSLRTPRFPLPM